MAVVDVDVIEIPDIEYSGYCFSDGVATLFALLITGGQNLRDIGGACH
jgi:hypothetical protein